VIKLIINGQKYYIHDQFLKKCEYFDKLDKSEKYELKLDYADQVIDVFFEILYGNYNPSLNRLKNVKDVLSLIEMFKYLGFKPEYRIIEDQVENFEFSELSVQNLKLIKNIKDDEIQRKFLMNFIQHQLTKIDDIIEDYDDYYPEKQRMTIESENSIKEIIKKCFWFHNLKCDDVSLEVTVWSDHENPHDAFRYKLNLEVDKKIKKDLDLDLLVIWITFLVLGQWIND
jgi:hypothetical protein